VFKLLSVRHCVEFCLEIGLLGFFSLHEAVGAEILADLFRRVLRLRNVKSNANFRHLIRSVAELTVAVVAKGQTFVLHLISMVVSGKIWLSIGLLVSRLSSESHEVTFSHVTDIKYIACNLHQIGVMPRLLPV